MKKTLYKKDSTGNIRKWVIWVSGNTIYTLHGVLDGQMVKKVKVISEGKNIGRSNETTPEEQALAEALSTWQKKKDKGYFESIEETKSEQVYLPMLAQSFTKRKHNIEYPAFVQPKLDGVRCLAKKISDTEIHFMSRGGKVYEALNQTHIKVDLLKWMKVDEIYDGEIYKHGWSLQRIASAVKKLQPDTDSLEYWVYDRAVPGAFVNRWAYFVNLEVEPSKCIKLVNTKYISDEGQVYNSHDICVKEGYEGVIIRNMDGMYKFGSRSADLQKYKQFIDEEFEIVGFTAENNNINEIDYECIVYTCKTKDGAEFSCRPRGSLESRQELYKKGNECVGKLLTVRYQALTDSSQGEGREVPQFPVGICVRDYE